MKKSLKPLLLIGLILIAVQGLFAQSIPTLELPRTTNVVNSGFGSSINPVVAEFKNDAANSNVFTTYTPTSTFSVALTNQQFTGLNYGTANYNGLGVSTLQTTGLVFGIGPSLITDPTPQGGNPYNRYFIIGEYGGNGGPTNAMFTSNPTATGAQLGTGIVVANSTTANGGVEVFTTAQALFNNPAYPVGSRVYFGDLVLKFSQPVKNPVIHLAGLGGSYRYLPSGLPDVPANYLSTYFSTELEMVNTGLTSTLMSSNSFMALSPNNINNGNNILNNNDVNPNGGSTNDPTEVFNNLGAATGSIKLTGTVQTITYRVYLQGGTGSQFAWSTLGTNITPGAPRDPFTGDIWYVAASYDKPVQQISGNVFIDVDGLTDNNINETLTTIGSVANAKTNVSNNLYAFLLNGATVVASVPVGSDGTFLFDNVANSSTYTVQLRTGAGGTAPGLPAGWINTGEFIGGGAGSDGSVNGVSAILVNVNPSNPITTNVNFGIERLPDSKSFTTVITSPQLNDIITLNSPLLPILTGSDPEDQPVEGILTGKTVKITTLPANSTLRYNGIAVTTNQVITGFNPALLTILFNIATTTSATQFNYAYVDAAGMPDPTPALYKVIWSGGPLVINLSEFTAAKNNCMANLVWKTSSETNSDRFEVEVSTGGTYLKVGTVAAIGNSTTTKSYRYSYAMKAGVTHYFRLKLVDKDGTFKYSDTRSLSCTDSKSGIVIAPNPVKTTFYISGMEKGTNSITIYAADGKFVKSIVMIQNQGYVDISNFASGLYIVKVTGENGDVVMSKLIKN